MSLVVHLCVGYTQWDLVGMQQMGINWCKEVTIATLR